jgi:hypothetical protein
MSITACRAEKPRTLPNKQCNDGTASIDDTALVILVIPWGSRDPYESCSLVIGP